MTELLESLAMFWFSILVLLVQVYLVTIVYQDLSKWTVLHYFSYAKILCFVVFFFVVKLALFDSTLAVQVYESLGYAERIGRQLGETLCMGLLAWVYFLAKRWVAL